MKKIYIIMMTWVGLTQISYAQWNTGTGGIYYNSGNVGIGTTNSNVPLHIYAGSANSITTGLRIQGGEGSTSSGSSLLFSSSYPYSDYQTARISAITTGWGTDFKSDLVFYSNTGANGTNLTEKMRITSAGNVGIGTTTPVQTLNVSGIQNAASGVTNDAGPLFVQNTTNNADVPALQDMFTFSRAGKSGVSYGNTANFKMGRYSQAGTPAYSQMTLSMNNGNTGDTDMDAMTWLSNGFVGIGTTAPKEALSVNGNIRSKQVKVELVNWPDYVFQPKYTLPTLKAVKTYIDQNHHLPDMPSEQEVTKNGLNLGEMNALLVKKVEELTLYQIQQEERSKQQDKRIAALEKALSKLAEIK